MGETASSIPPGGIGTLQLSDFWKGLIKTLAGLIVGVIVQTIDEKHFPTYEQLAPLLKAGIYFIVGYLGINFGTNNVGQFLKPNKPTVTVGAKELDQVIDFAAEGKKI